MTIVPLTLGLVAIVDAEDAERVLAHPWCAKREDRRSGPPVYYAHRATGGNKTVTMHRFILGARRGEIVDHKNRNTLDNRRCNLRLASASQSRINRTFPNSTGFRGVSQVRGKFIAVLTCNGARFYGGSFPTAENAARAYDELALVHHGEFAVLNFPTREAA